MTDPDFRDTDPADSKRQGRATRPKLSATLILLREENSVLQFLMGKRTSAHRFMPNKFVFPGGGVDRQDARAPLATPIGSDVLEVMAAHIPAQRACAVACAAIRETYEETGLKLAQATGEAQSAPAEYQAFTDNHLGLDLGALSVLARAITPPYHPKRFDTWFFTAKADTLIDDPADLASGELEQLQWVSCAQVADMDLPLITRAVLQDLQIQAKDPTAAKPYYYTRRGQHIRSFL
ncbi:MAG: NUDIX hydrolase [Robiginitomaculum sp.]|nr:NUDIX hydrolase [Robiginitomaculum sp.]